MSGRPREEKEDLSIGLPETDARAAMSPAISCAGAIRPRGASVDARARGPLKSPAAAGMRFCPQAPLPT